MLVSVVAAPRLHVEHPEMIGEGADLVHGLLEAELDLEAQTVKTNDVDGVEGGVRAHEEDGASCWMDHRDEAHHTAGRSPEQVADAILDGQLVLAVDGAVGLLEGRGIIQQRLHFELVAVLPGRASLARRCPAWCSPRWKTPVSMPSGARSSGPMANGYRSSNRQSASMPSIRTEPRELIEISLCSWFEHRLPESVSHARSTNSTPSSGRGFATVSESHWLPKK